MHIANQILARFTDRLPTKRVVCEPGLTRHMPGLLGEFLPAGCWLIVADDNTWEAQGRTLADAMAASGLPFRVIRLSPPAGRAELVCDLPLVGQVVVGVKPGISALIAVGSGTICDTVKLAAAAAKLPSAAVATAPSMNGYPSIIAAVLRDGVKRTDPARPPVLVLADLDVLCAAPARMIAAGLADLLAKPVSTADWTLANAVLGDPISADGLEVVEESARLAAGIAGGLPGREPTAVARLFEALFVSGLAMAVSGASSPASGGEHLISHYLDMTALASGTAASRAVPGEGAISSFSRDPELADRRAQGSAPAGERVASNRDDRPRAAHDLHGLQVGVATLVAARLYERLLAWDVASLNIEQRVKEQRPWPLVEAELKTHFGPILADAVIAQARKLYVEGDALADRLTKLQRIFPELKPRLAQRLQSPESIERELLAAGAATRFDKIGVDRPRALAAVRFAHHVRARYTILHLLADLGLLDEWAKDAVR